MAVLFAGLTAVQARAQSRPLTTQDPEPVGSGQVLADLGFDYSRAAFYPSSGLHGNLTRFGTFDVSFGISPIAEIQLSGGFHDRLAITSRDPAAPLAGLLALKGTSTGDVEDGVMGAKIRLVRETVSHPSFAFRFSTRLPNAKHDSGLGLSTTDFSFGILTGKTVGEWRVVGNLGVGILQDQVHDGIQNDVLTYGGSLARTLAPGVEVVGEVNGHIDSRHGTPPVGTETRSMARFGTRYTRGALRYDAGLLIGLTTHDPTWGITGGLTWVFQAFTIQ
jgi:hypothetical protein